MPRLSLSTPILLAVPILRNGQYCLYLRICLENREWRWSRRCGLGGRRSQLAMFATRSGKGIGRGGCGRRCGARPQRRTPPRSAGWTWISPPQRGLRRRVPGVPTPLGPWGRFLRTSKYIQLGPGESLPTGRSKRAGQPGGRNGSDFSRWGATPSAKALIRYFFTSNFYLYLYLERQGARARGWTGRNRSRFSRCLELGLCVSRSGEVLPLPVNHAVKAPRTAEHPAGSSPTGCFASPGQAAEPAQ